MALAGIPGCGEQRWYFVGIKNYPVCLPPAVFEHFISLKIILDFIILLARSPLLMVCIR